MAALLSLKTHCLDFFTLCKPKVVGTMLITSWVGMCLAEQTLTPEVFLFGTLGIAFSAGAAAVFNHLADRHIDAKMSRTLHRPIASGRILPKDAITFAFILALTGLCLLIFYVNLLTGILTLITIFGYAIFYTLFLKRATPQNIVIGGAAGATPPLLGWSSVSGTIEADALILVLIIFTWTPPHFWSLAIYRFEDYKNAKIPMLPVTHGIPYTKLCILLYTCLLFAVSLFPFITGMSSYFYLVSCVILNILFLKSTWDLYSHDSKQKALKTFSFSIWYLLLLFTALLLDHYWKP